MRRPARNLARFQLVPLLLSLEAAAQAPAPAPVPLPADTAVKEVVSLLTGTFDSRDQSAADPEGFRAVRLVAVLVPKSRLGLGAPVLYLEQAMVATPDKPYRQRFYRIEEVGDGTVVSRVFEPKDARAVAGKWRTASDLAVFGPNDVLERSGCAVVLRKKGDRWEGGTEGTKCPSALSGARYATSQVSLGLDRMESWDRGYDAAGKQVWGAAAGPYVFVRRSEGVPTDAPAPR
jgi:CpeT protein